MLTPISSIVLIEDDEHFSSLFAALINSSDHYYINAVYNNCEEAIAKLRLDRPDIVLMDLDLPRMNGIQGTLKIKQQFPSAEIVILTVHNNIDKVFNALSAGAVGYLTKDSNLDTLLYALDEIRMGGAPMSIEIARMVVRSFAKNQDVPFSSKETEVLTLLSEGKSYKSIAGSLAVSINTVKFHIKNIYVALQVTNRENAVEIAKKNNWI